jgi:hypothetical protein
MPLFLDCVADIMGPKAAAFRHDPMLFRRRLVLPSNPAFAEQYARAREFGYQAMADGLPDLGRKDPRWGFCFWFHPRRDVRGHAPQYARTRARGP